MAREYWLLPEVPHATYAAYLADVGSSAIAKAWEMRPEEVLAELERSGLRGRGGAGFPAATKWKTLAAHPCPTRYVVCNAAEGEPGTFKDRFLLRRSPYPTLEGVLIACRVLGAERAFVGIKASFEPELARLRAALAEIEAAGHSFGVQVELVPGPGEYLFGEEKALLRFIEDGVPMPRLAEEPPYEIGLYAGPGSPNPALVGNVETFAHVPSIVRAGGDGFRALGTSDTPGTVLFTISGDVARPGVYELEAGRPVGEILNEVAGGPRGEPLALVLSGVSTGPILPDKLGTPADFGSLALIGSGLGSAGFIVLDRTRSIPRVAQRIARFLYVESCNQCTACKHGLGVASRALDELFDPGEASDDSLESAEYGARSAPQGNRCYLPVQGSVLIPALLRRFADRFTEHIASGLAQDAEPWTLPLIVDFDEQRGQFVYDERADRKQPDWSFEPPAPAPERTEGALASVTPAGPVGVRLAPDVLAALRARERSTGRTIAALVDELLREGLDLRGR